MSIQAHSTSIAAASSLAERRNDLTQRLILAAAIELLEHASVGDLTVRGIAARANISERTVFRYFATRDELLDAVAAEVTINLHLPPPPESVVELLALPALLYRSFDAKTHLAEAALHSELFHRIRNTAAKQRWAAVAKLLERHAPAASAQALKVACANIRYFLSATTWHYYRFNFGFSLEDTIACAETAITQSMEGLLLAPTEN